MMPAGALEASPINVEKVASRSGNAGLLWALPADAVDPPTAAIPHHHFAFEVALESMPVGVSWARISDGAFVFVNHKFTEMFGYDVGSFATIQDWTERAYPLPEDRVRARAAWGTGELPETAHRLTLEPIEVCVECLSGERKAVRMSGVLLPETGWALATFVDLSEARRSESRLQLAEHDALENQAIYRLLVDHSPEMMIVSPLNGRSRYVSPAVETLTGFTAEEFLAIPLASIMHEDDRDVVRQVETQMREGLLSHTLRFRIGLKEGGHRWVEASVTGYQEPGTTRVGGYVATVRDFSDQKEREDKLAAEYLQLSRVALRDELTGVANRRGFNTMLHKESLRQSRSKHDLSLFLLDVDCFKQFNDLYGHPAGDDCLRRVVRAVQSSLRRESDLLARFGGEEFVALLPMTDAAGAHILAHRVRENVAQLRIPHSGSSFGVVTISVGVSTWPAGEVYDEQALVADADVALYRAKERGRNAVCLANNIRRIGPSQTHEAPLAVGERRRA